jgi:hypothetical protein
LCKSKEIFLTKRKMRNFFVGRKKGDSFVIPDKNAFSEILRGTFGGQDLRSFTFNLVKFGFLTVRTDPQTQKKCGEYHNPYFKRDRPNLMWLFSHMNAKKSRLSKRASIQETQENNNGENEDGGEEAYRDGDDKEDRSSRPKPSSSNDKQGVGEAIGNENIRSRSLRQRPKTKNAELKFSYPTQPRPQSMKTPNPPGHEIPDDETIPAESPRNSVDLPQEEPQNAPHLPPQLIRSSADPAQPRTVRALPANPINYKSPYTTPLQNQQKASTLPPQLAGRRVEGYPQHSLPPQTSGKRQTAPSKTDRLQLKWRSCSRKRGSWRVSS